MPWLEVSTGHYQRPIGENEKFIKAVGDRAHSSDREHWSITCSVSFVLRGSRSSEEDTLSVQLRSGWKALRFEHPSIASTAEKETLDYLVPDNDSLQKWAEETFFIHDAKMTTDNLIASFKPHPSFTAHYLPGSSQIVLHTAHWRTDGLGALQILNAFFEEWSKVTEIDPAELPWGQEVERLVPSVEEVLSLPVIATPEIEAAAEQYISTLAYAKGAVGLSYKGDESTLPSGTRSARLRLSETDTKVISEACKSRGIGILSAVHASVAAITYVGASESSKNKHYSSTIRLSLRPHLPKPYSSARSASGLYTGGYFCKVPASQSWKKNSEQYDDEYRRGVTIDFLRARRQYALRVQDLQRKAPAPAEGPPPSEIDISSVDDAELLVNPIHRSGNGSIHIVDVSVGVETLTRQMYCFVWTFRGQLDFNLVYNEAYYDADFAEELLGKLKEVLQRELDGRSVTE